MNYVGEGWPTGLQHGVQEKNQLLKVSHLSTRATDNLKTTLQQRAVWKTGKTLQTFISVHVIVQSSCNPVAVETSLRRALVFTKPSNFFKAQALLEISRKSFSNPILLLAKSCSSSSLIGSTPGSVRFGCTAIVVKMGVKRKRCLTQVLISAQTGGSKMDLPSRNKDLTSSFVSHSFQTPSITKGSSVGAGMAAM